MPTEHRGGQQNKKELVTGKPMSVSCLMSRFSIQASSCLPDVFMPWNEVWAKGVRENIFTHFFQIWETPKIHVTFKATESLCTNVEKCCVPGSPRL